MKQCTPSASRGNLFAIGFRPVAADWSIVSDAPGRWRLSLFRFICTPNKLAAVLPPGTRALLPHSSTGSDRYTGMIYIRDQRTVRKLTLTPSSFWEFFDRVMVSGCLVSSS